MRGLLSVRVEHVVLRAAAEEGRVDLTSNAEVARLVRSCLRLHASVRVAMTVGAATDAADDSSLAEALQALCDASLVVLVYVCDENRYVSRTFRACWSARPYVLEDARAPAARVAAAAAAADADAADAVADADAVLVVGSSLQVFSAFRLVRAASAQFAGQAVSAANQFSENMSMMRRTALVDLDAPARWAPDPLP